MRRPSRSCWFIRDASWRCLVARLCVRLVRWTSLTPATVRSTRRVLSGVVSSTSMMAHRRAVSVMSRITSIQRVCCSFNVLPIYTQMWSERALNTFLAPPIVGSIVNGDELKKLFTLIKFAPFFMRNRFPYSTPIFLCKKLFNLVNQ